MVSPAKSSELAISINSFTRSNSSERNAFLTSDSSSARNLAKFHLEGIIPGINLAILSASKSGNTFSVDASNYRRSAFVLEAYFFAIYPLTLPAWGVAIWDAEGTLVLTNESRVLSDLTTIGSPGAATGGLNIDTYMAGKWAVNPMGLGSVILHAGSAPGGQPIFQSVDVGTGCHDDTGGTRIRGQSSTTASGSSIGSTNSGIVITAINTAAYD